MPMYQCEAMWLNFTGSYPTALKVATGKVCAVSGESWSNRLGKNPQNYLALPAQPTLSSAYEITF